jgi:TM2 domain-containing membrane protein YozV
MAAKNGKADAHGASPLLALFLAWLIPGAGHAYLGRRARGIVIFVTIGATFWAGVAIGGVMTMDYYFERWWFAAEVLTGIHGLVGWQHQRQVYARMAREDPQIGLPRPAPGGEVTPQQVRIDRWLSEEGIALVAPGDKLARSYAGVAGLLNLMCMFDAMVLALMGVRGEPASKEPHPQTRAGGQP